MYSCKCIPVLTAFHSVNPSTKQMPVTLNWLNI